MATAGTGGGDQERADTSFTLTEVMVAVTLMLIALGALLSALVSSMRSASMTQTHCTAMRIAGTEAEQLLTNSYTNISTNAATLTNTCVVYAISRSVISRPSATNDQYKDITIAVNWTAPGSSRRQALTNYLTICNPD